MSTKPLFEDLDILAYVRTNGQFGGTPPWIFIHVPETVKGWFREQLADALQPDHYLQLSGAEHGENHDAKMLNALRSFSSSAQFRRARFVSGHVKVFQINSVPELERARRLTMFRDPVDRLLSDFSAQIHGSQPTPSGFLEFAKNPANQNVFLQFLCPKSMWKPKECIRYVTDNFNFIGIWEDATMSLKLFHSLLGMRATIRQDDVNASNRQLARTDLSPDIIRTVAQLNAVDYDMYRYFHDRFVELRAKFFELNDYGEMFWEIAPEASER